MIYEYKMAVQISPQESAPVREACGVGKTALHQITLVTCQLS